MGTDAGSFGNIHDDKIKEELVVLQGYWKNSSDYEFLP